MLRKTIAATCAVVFCLAGATSVHGNELRIGTASQGGVYYPIGQGISNLVTNHAEGLTMVPVVTQGSAQNPRLVDTGEVALGLTNANLALLAIEGKGPYKGKPLKIAAVAALHPSVLHMFAHADSPITDFEDIKGKRVAVGPAGGGTLSFLQRLLEAHGMSISDITPSFLSYNDGFSQLGDGKVDAAFALAGYPTSAVTQARATNKLKAIRIDGTKLNGMVEKYPHYRAVTIPKDVYRLTDDATTLGVNNLLITHTDMPEEQVYKIAKALFEHLDEFRAENANARQIDPDQSRKLPIPLHQGAARYLNQ